MTGPGPLHRIDRNGHHPRRLRVPRLHLSREARGRIAHWASASAILAAGIRANCYPVGNMSRDPGTPTGMLSTPVLSTPDAALWPFPLPTLPATTDPNQRGTTGPGRRSPVPPSRTAFRTTPTPRPTPPRTPAPGSRDRALALAETVLRAVQAFLMP